MTGKRVFDAFLTQAESWKPYKGSTPQRNPRHRLSEAAICSILRMKVAGYSAWEAFEQLGIDHSTCKDIFIQHNKGILQWPMKRRNHKC